MFLFTSFDGDENGVKQSWLLLYYYSGDLLWYTNV